MAGPHSKPIKVEPNYFKSPQVILMYILVCVGNDYSESKAQLQINLGTFHQLGDHCQVESCYHSQ